MPHRHQLNSVVLAELTSLALCRDGFSVKPVQKAGAVNTSYCLTTPSGRFFMKMFESDQVNQLDRQQLFDIQKAVWQKGMACEPVYLSTAAGFQLDAWVQSHTLENSTLREDVKAHQLADALHRIHSLDIEGHRLNLPAQWAGYLSQLPQQPYWKEHEEARELAGIWSATPAHDLVFCHNDLSFQHVTAEQPNVIFDWEYCALSNRYFDLAACIEVNNLNYDVQTCLLSRYAQLTQLPFPLVLQKTTEMLPLVNLTSRLWYAVAEKITASQCHTVDKISG